MAVTVNTFAEDYDACLEAGMDLHLQKPMRLVDLDGAISKLEQRGLLPGSRKEGD